MNFQIKIDVSKIDKNSLFKGEKGNYLTIDCIEMKEPSKYGFTHFVKQVIDKDVFKAMSEEDRKAIPIIGNMKPVERTTKEQQQSTPPPSEKTDDLPF